MYGTQTEFEIILRNRSFENDVKMYGTQTFMEKDKIYSSLRMM